MSKEKIEEEYVVKNPDVPNRHERRKEKALYGTEKKLKRRMRERKFDELKIDRENHRREMHAQRVERQREAGEKRRTIRREVAQRYVVNPRRVIIDWRALRNGERSLHIIGYEGRL